VDDAKQSVEIEPFDELVNWAIDHSLLLGYASSTTYFSILEFRRLLKTHLCYRGTRRLVTIAFRALCTYLLTYYNDA